MGRLRKSTADRILEMSLQGFTVAEITEKTGAAPATVRRYRAAYPVTDVKAGAGAGIENDPEVREAQRRLKLAELERNLRQVTYPEGYDERVSGLEHRVQELEEAMWGVLDEIHLLSLREGG